jgi:hypothetical protein
MIGGAGGQMHLMRSFVSAVTATTAPRRIDYGSTLLNI